MTAAERIILKISDLCIDQRSFRADDLAVILPQVLHKPNARPSGENKTMLTVRVVPRSSRSEVVGLHGEALKVKLSAPPVDGAANAELIALLAKKLGVPNSSIEITSGQSSKNKQLRIIGLTPERLWELLSD
jgi:uncharacterized protein (TIGR00251 family)